MATKASLKLAEYTVTEAGFGADLGAEKFIDIKCHLTGLRPQAVCMVATVKALKHHGGVNADGYKVENLEALQKGLANIDKHIDNIREHYKLPVVISCNHFYHDTDAELKLVMDHMAAKKVPAVIGRHWAEGGKGAESVAREIITAAEAATPSPLTTVYPADMDLFAKVEAIATKRGAPTGHTLEIRDARFCNGAGFAVVMAGDIMTMPGLPAVPAAEAIDVDENGKIVGLF